MRNKIIIGFLATHTVLFLIALCARGWDNPNPFHFYAESRLVNILIILDLPSLLVAGVFAIPVIFWLLGLSADSSTIWFQLIVFFLCASFQWIAVAVGVNRFVFGSKTATLTKP
jgi:hypothetical protein